MTGSYAIRIAWERFNKRKALMVMIIVLTCCFCAIFFTARPAEAKKQMTQQKEAYKYYTAITVQPGDSMWGIAQRQLSDPQTAEAYSSKREYIKEVVSLNRLKNADYLMAGQRLIVPYYTFDYKD